MHEKQNIIIVLLEAVRISQKFKFRGIRMSSRIENLKQSQILPELKIQIERKIELFKNMPQDCESYKHILKNARIALHQLKDHDYNLASYELINDFLSIESIFVNDLKFVGIREYEKIEKQKEIKICQKISSNGKIKYLKTGIKSIDIINEEKKKQYVKQLLEDINI